VPAISAAGHWQAQALSGDASPPSSHLKLAAYAKRLYTYSEQRFF